jgi:hypothetical protein
MFFVLIFKITIVAIIHFLEIDVLLSKRFVIFNYTVPFCCYYCDTTCTEFDNIIKHSVINHSLDVLKIKHLELNEKNGIYSYRSHNFNIIPRELDSTGKKIETDTTLDSLKLHIVLDKSSDIKFRRKIEPKVLSALQNKYQTVK